MNNSKIWLVVKPTVGVPLFLTAVAVGSFAVHVAVLSNTTWVSDFLSGQELGSTQTAALPMDVDTNATLAEATTAPVVTGDTQEVVVILPDGTRALAVLKPTTDVAALDSHLVPTR